MPLLVITMELRVFDSTLVVGDLVGDLTGVVADDDTDTFVPPVEETGMVTLSAFIEEPTVISFTSLRVFSLGEVEGEEDDLMVILDTLEPAEVGVSNELVAEPGVPLVPGLDVVPTDCRAVLAIAGAAELRLRLAGFEDTEEVVSFGVVLLLLAFMVVTEDDDDDDV